MKKKELANQYKVSVKTFNKWIAPFEDIIGKMVARAYTPKQVKLIYKYLGRP